ncbi:MAG: hypothetical protein WBS24_08645 [Terriglobales bacterium]
MPSTPNWNEAYRRALTETHPRKLQRRIAVARRAIMERIKLTPTIMPAYEQMMIDDALNSLRTLQAEFDNQFQEFEELHGQSQPG